MNPYAKAGMNVIGWIILVPVTVIYFGCVGVAMVFDKKSQRMHQ